MTGTSLKATITLALTALAAYFTNLAIPLLVLLALVILDYVTGMTNAWIHRQLSSQKGIHGIVKKLGYFIAIIVAMSVDYLIIKFTEYFNISIAPQVTIVAMLVTIWLILNEALSILENLDKIGTPIPSFLKKLIERLKQKTEEKGESESDGE